MDFKNNFMAGAVLAAISMGSFAAEMNAGTVHFTGEIIEPSCTIQGDSGTDSTVPLGTYPKSLFKAVGTESSLTPFSITLANCPVKKRRCLIKFFDYCYRPMYACTSEFSPAWVNRNSYAMGKGF